MNGTLISVEVWLPNGHLFPSTREEDEGTTGASPDQDKEQSKSGIRQGRLSSLTKGFKYWGGYLIYFIVFLSQNVGRMVPSSNVEKRVYREFVIHFHVVP